MFGKIIDGKLVIAGKKIQIENGWITNPTEQQLEILGYKRIEYGTKPEYDREEEKLVETYQDMDSEIYVGYDKVVLTDEEHNAIIQNEIYDEEYKITQRNLRNAIKGDEFALNKITEIENNIAKLREKLR